MGTVSLELFKKHTRTDDFDGDDDYLRFLLETAEAAVVRATERDEAELFELGDGSLPLELQQAIMMLAAHWYNQRESVAAVQIHKVPDSLTCLIKPFVKLIDN